MIYTGRKGQVSYGEAIGILLLDSSPVPFIPGDVANATSYRYPVRFHKIPGLTVARAIGKDPVVFDDLLTAARELESHGVRAITSDCGFLGFHQKKLAESISVPVFLSSLLQIPFIHAMLPESTKIGVVTADAAGFDEALLEAVGVGDTRRLAVAGLENRPHFRAAALEETGTLDTDQVQQEVVDTAAGLLEDHPAIGALLLECSLLPPYGAAIQEATGLPVFDFLTMIDHVFSAVVKRRFDGFM